MGYVESRNQSQQGDDESEPKYKWVQCPDMPEGLLTIDDNEMPYKTPKGTSTESLNDNSQSDQYEIER